VVSVVDKSVLQTILQEVLMPLAEPPSEPRVRYDEEIRLITQIIERADRSVRPRPGLLIAWGTIAALADLSYFVYYWRYYNIGPSSAPHMLLALGGVAYIVLLVISVASLTVPRWKARVTMVDQQLTITFGVAATIAYLVSRVGYTHDVMVGADYAMLANALFAVPMLSVGIQYRCAPLALGGLALVVSLIVPHFDPYRVDLYMALGMTFGLVLPGLYYAVRRHA
jgi:hypothetical protein